MASQIERPPTYNESIQNDNYNEIPLPHVVTNRSEEKMVNTYNLASTIKCIAMIDIILSILNIFYYFPLITLVIFPLMGYYGANIYNRYLTLGYVFYKFLYIFFQIYRFLYFTNNIYEKIFLIFGITISLIIIQITLKFFRILGELNDEQLQELKLGFIPVTTRYIWY